LRHDPAVVLLARLQHLERVWSRFQFHVRQYIRRAQEQLAVRTDMEDIERFLDLRDGNWQLGIFAFG
jgi:hypothetical protein